MRAARVPVAAAARYIDDDVTHYTQCDGSRSLKTVVGQQVAKFSVGGYSHPFLGVAFLQCTLLF
jgi:hypothetical protein